MATETVATYTLATQTKFPAGTSEVTITEMGTAKYVPIYDAEPAKYYGYDRFRDLGGKWYARKKLS